MLLIVRFPGNTDIAAPRGGMARGVNDPQQTHVVSGYMTSVVGLCEPLGDHRLKSLIELAEGLERKRRALAKDMRWKGAAAISPRDFHQLPDHFLTIIWQLIKRQ